MTKRKEEPRSESKAKQLELFRPLEEASDGTRGSTSWSQMRAELLCRLSEQRALTTQIVDKIGDHVNLFKAFEKVRHNQGSSGVDGVSIEAYEQSLASQVEQLSERLLNGSYRPQPVRLVEIPKPNGGKRRLGIPTVEDRLVQQSILQALQPIYDPHFSESSYGFRPGRSAHQAVLQAARYVQAGKIWVVDIDLESFFDKICHDRLMGRLSKAITDDRLLQLIRRYLKADLMQGGLVSQRLSGTPQGGPLSPLLSNIVLDELDRELELRGLSFARYADDCNVFVKTRRSAERVMTSLIDFIENKLKLKVNRKKSGVRPCDQVKFLGHTIEQNGKIRIADANLKRFQKRIIEITKRNRGVRFSHILREVNQVIHGWGVYYRCCNTWLSDLRELDGWVRLRLRCYRLKQCKKRYATFKFLRNLGLEQRKAWNCVLYHAWWPMANHPAVRNGMNIKWFQDQGLKSLQAIQKG